MLMKVFIIILLVGGVFSQWPTAANIDVRLVGNRTHFPYGRVQVLHNGTWGTLCNRQWNLNDGHVVCRQLGFDGAVSVFSESRYEPGTKWMNNLQCRGNESSLSGCVHGRWIPVSYCLYHAVAMCTLRVRLTEGSSPKEGLVQLYIKNTWGRVCGEQWDKQDADVVCRWLGYHASSEAYTTYLQISADIWMNNVQCTGDEDSLFTCVYDGWTNRSCMSNRMAGVKCNGSEVRLVSRGSSLPASMEVLSGGFWGPVCSFGGNTENGNVFCRQLGYDGALAVSNYGEQQWEICLKVQCIGNESSILGCRNSGWTSNYYWTSVLCSPAVRLVEGPSAREGLVQAYYNRTWGWVCAEQWDKQDGDVACKELGYTGSSTIYNKSPNVRGNVTLWMSDIRCTGNESSLVSCTHGGWKFLGCGSVGQTAGVVCAGQEVRLVSNDSPLHRVEVLFGGFWWPVCSYQWNIKDANVVCRQLGHGDALAMPIYLLSIFMRNAELCLGQLGCSGNESSVLQCRHGGWSINEGVSDEEKSGILVARAVCSPSSVSGRPEYVSSDLASVYMTWISSQSLNYTVQMWNNKTRSWETARCYESKAVGSCLVDAPRATVVGLTSSTTYFFRIIVDNMTISATSKPMKTKQLGTPGKPLLVSKTFITITIKWNSPYSLHNITYTVQMQTDTEAPWMDAKCSDQSLLPNRCIIKGSVAMVTGLKQNTVYRFRVYAMFKGVRSDFSLPSDSIRTSGDVELLSFVFWRVRFVIPNANL